MQVEFLDGTKYLIREDGKWVSLNWGIRGMWGSAMNKIVPDELASVLQKDYEREQEVLNRSRNRVRKAQERKDKRFVKKNQEAKVRAKSTKPVQRKKRTIKPKAAKSRGTVVKIFDV